jgi:hypothetical protein
MRDQFEQNASMERAGHIGLKTIYKLHHEITLECVLTSVNAISNEKIQRTYQIHYDQCNPHEFVTEHLTSFNFRILQAILLSLRDDTPKDVLYHILGMLFSFRNILLSTPKDEIWQRELQLDTPTFCKNLEHKHLIISFVLGHTGTLV